MMVPYFSSECLSQTKLLILKSDAIDTIYNWQWPTVLAAFIVCYTAYYFTVVIRKPKLVGGDGWLMRNLEKNLKVVKEHYWPTFWCFSAHMMTVCRVIFKRKPFVPYRR